ncbi:MAG: YceI family protein [Pseudomonadota bacterium]
MKRHLLTVALGLCVGMAGIAHADGWTLDGASSTIAYGTIKSNEVGELNRFRTLSGSVSEDGAVEIAIDLGSVDTMVDIRNERMIEHVFKNAPAATLTADLDMEKLNALGVGEISAVDVEANLSLVGIDVPLDANLTIARLAEDRVFVTTTDMVMFHTADAELDPAIDTLKELAGLDIITRVAPVSMTLVFDAETPES